MNIVKIIQVHFEDLQIKINKKWKNKLSCNTSPAYWDQICRNIQYIKQLTQFNGKNICGRL